jgi:NhaP-type Na+/H+ or K+/H+ antiporter
MFFAAVGVVAVAAGLGEEPTGDVTGVAAAALEMTLALVLFTDAMATNITSWREEGELPSRLLIPGMPLIILAGAIVAAGVFPELDLVGAAMVATILAPTDAALGKPVVSNTRVPVRIREALNIESGLNDGIALPFLLFFIAIGEAEEGANLGSLLLSAIGVAVVVGLAVGWVSARLIIASSERGWMVPMWRQIAVVVVPVVAYVVADELGGSGFIATFVGGLTFGRLLLASYPDIGHFAEDLAEVLTMVAFMIFGGLLLQPRFGEFTWEMLLYALLSLTLIRMLPVAISMIGTDLRPPTLLYMGWFGPRGLASLIFAAIVIEEVDLPATDLMVNIVILTVALSILLHGITAYPGSKAYADWYEQQEDDHDEMHESKDVESIQKRRRITRA